MNTGVWVRVDARYGEKNLSLEKICARLENDASYRILTMTATSLLVSGANVYASWLVRDQYGTSGVMLMKKTVFRASFELLSL